MTKVSVIITNYNNRHNIKNCIESVLKQKKLEDIELEIIVVDAGSNDDSQEILKYYNQIKIFYNNDTIRNVFSPSTCRNIGVENSNGELLFFIDSDCIASENWISDMIKHFRKNENIVCVFGGRKPDLGRGIGTFYRSLYTIIYSRKFRLVKDMVLNKNTINKRLSSFVLMATNNLSIKKSAWLSLGRMSESFANPAGEDILMEFELIQAGYTLIFDPNIKIEHNHPLSLKSLIKKSWQQDEAIFLVRKLAMQYVDWKHFVELNNFLKNIIISIIIAIGIFALVPTTGIKIQIIGLFILLLIVKRVSELKTRLKMALEFQDNLRYQNYYKISFIKLLLFDLIDFLTKGCRITSYCYYSFVKEQDVF